MHTTDMVTISFVVRMTKEPRDIEVQDSTGAWRGLVQHIQSGSERRFLRLEDLFEFIESYVEPVD